jgi:hypothetical protein
VIVVIVPTYESAHTDAVFMAIVSEVLLLICVEQGLDIHFRGLSFGWAGKLGCSPGRSSYV